MSEPDRNQGGSLVLPGLELLPVPEPLLNFELETKDGRSVTNLKKSHTGQKDFLLPGLTETNVPQVFLQNKPLGSGFVLNIIQQNESKYFGD